MLYATVQILLYIPVNYHEFIIIIIVFIWFFSCPFIFLNCV